MLNPTTRGSLLRSPHQDPKLPDPRSKTLTSGAAPQLALGSRKAEVRRRIVLTFTRLPVPSGILCLHSQGLAATRGPQMKSS